MLLSGNILNEIKRLSAEIPDILAVYLHGSYAYGDATPLSDVDLAVLLERPTDSGLENLEFELDMEVLLSSKIPSLRFDVRTINNAPIIVLGKIITQGKLIYARDHEKISDFGEKIIAPYLDFKIEYDKIIEETFKAEACDQ